MEEVQFNGLYIVADNFPSLSGVLFLSEKIEGFYSLMTEEEHINFTVLGRGGQYLILNQPAE